MSKIVPWHHQEPTPDDVEHLIVRQTENGQFKLSAKLSGEPDEFEVTGQTYTTMNRALEAAHSFAKSMKVEHIYLLPKQHPGKD